MEGAGGGDDEDDYEVRCEYATLTCRRTAAATETRVHVKVWFDDDRAAADRHDDDDDDGQTTVFRAHVAVEDTGDVYSGRVSRSEAAAETDAASDDSAGAVRRWLENARRALVGPRDGDEEYAHRLDAGADGGAAALAWKLKLRPFGAVALGSVRLRRDPVGPCRAFVGPLVGRLSAERSRARRAELAAAEDARRLSADNGRLLDALRSAADRRRLDDARLTARFVRVLNAKKDRLAAALRELKELKEPEEPRERRSDDDDDDSTADEPGVTTGRGRRERGRGRGRGARGRAGKRGSTVARAVSGKRGGRPFFGFGGRADADGDRRRRRLETMETDDCGGRGTVDVVPANPVSASPDDADFDVFGADTQIDGDDVDAAAVAAAAVDGRWPETMETDDCGRGTETVVATANPVSAPPDDADFDVFGADTQIDGDDPSSSPSFFRQISSTQLADTDEPPPEKDVESHNKSFLDDLWHGIL